MIPTIILDKIYTTLSNDFQKYEQVYMYEISLPKCKPPAYKDKQIQVCTGHRYL